MSSQFDYQGFDVVSPWNGALTSANAASALDAIVAVGSNDVGLSPKLLISTAKSNQLVTDPVQSTSDASLIAGIRTAQAKGLKVLLEPHLQALDGTASSQLAPTDPTSFFASYKAALVHLATIAQQTGVDTLSVGNEMSTLSGSANRAQWLDVIAAVRKVYSGKLTYEAATFEASSVSFWDKVDVIGLNAYLSLSTNSNPTVSDLEKAWTTPPVDNYIAGKLNGQSVVDFMHSMSTTYGKQVLVTEVGYRSIDGAATNPGQWDRTGTADNTDQSNAYQALFQVMQSQGGRWFAGLNLWQYTIDPSASATSYDPVGKPAMSLVQQYFSGTEAVAGLAVHGSAVGDLIDIGAGNDTVDAGLGNDSIYGGAGNDTLIGGPDKISRLTTTTVTITGYGALGKDGGGGQVALLVNGQQVGGTATFTPASNASGYQTYTITFANPDQVRSLDLLLLNRSTGAAAMIRGITVNGAALATTDATNASAPGTFNLYANSIHLDATSHQDLFYGSQSDDDLMMGGAGNDTINGGAGIDTAVYKGPLNAYTFSRSGSSLTVKDSVTGRDGQDVLTGVEHLQFSDQTVAVASLNVPDANTPTVSSLMSPLLKQATVLATSTPQIVANGVAVAGATVTLSNGSTVLATATADQSGQYNFSLTNVASGIYNLTTQAVLGSLKSAPSDPACLVIGSSTTIVGLLAAAPSLPRAVYLTDADPIRASVAQLRSVAGNLAQAVTPYSLAIADTASTVLASMDYLGSQPKLATVTLTDTHVFNVTQVAMAQIIANNASTLAKIQGGYSFAVATTTTSGAARTTSYDSTGAMTSVKTVTVTGTTTETYITTAAGATSDTFTNASGTTISETVVTASGKQFTQYGITGKPYSSGTYTYNTAGQLTGYTEYYAGGGVYDSRTTAADGTVTTRFFNTSGTITQQVAVAPSGGTDTIVYDAKGAKLTETVLDAGGKQFTQYGITGKPYSSGTYTYNTAGQLTGYTEYYAGGSVYDNRTTAADGTVTTRFFNTSGTITQQIAVAPNGGTDTIAYDAKGAKLTETVLNASGKQFTQYGITGKPYVWGTYIYNTAGQLTGWTEYYAGGGVYDNRTTAADGTVTTRTYDTSGALTKQTTTSPNGTTSTLNAVVSRPMLAGDVAKVASPTTSSRLTLNLSEDAYKGDAQFTVSVDGQQIGGVQAVTALHSAGRSQDFVFTGSFGSVQHVVSIDFLNDLYGGSTAADRNLYVNAISFDGTTSIINSEQGQMGSASYAVQPGSGTPYSGSNIDVNSGTTLVVAQAAAGSTVEFKGTDATLELSIPQDFHASIMGFAANNAIDLRGIDAGHFKLAYDGTTSGGVLNVSDATHSASLALTGQYAASDFRVAGDSFGGTAITLVHHA